MDFYDMAEIVDNLILHLRIRRSDPELEGEVDDLIRELSTIAEVLYTLWCPTGLRGAEKRKTRVRKLWAKANNERGRF